MVLASCYKLNVICRNVRNLYLPLYDRSSIATILTIWCVHTKLYKIYGGRDNQHSLTSLCVSLAISKVHVINLGQWSLSGSDVSPWDWGPARAILKAPGTGWHDVEMEEVSWLAWVLCEKDTSLYCGSLQSSRFSVEVPCDIYGYTLDILFHEFLPFSFYLLNSIASTYPSFLKVESYPMTISWLISPFPYPWDFRLLVIFALVWFCLHKQCCRKYLYTDNFT